MKYTAAAVAATLTWISAAALAAPVFDGSTLQNGALKALPQDTEQGAEQSSPQSGSVSAYEAEPASGNSLKELETEDNAPQKIFKDFNSTAEFTDENEAPADSAPAAASPVIGKSIKSIQHSDNPF